MNTIEFLKEGKRAAGLGIGTIPLYLRSTVLHDAHGVLATA